VIVGHHGGEAGILHAVLATVGSVPVLLMLFRAQLGRLGRRLRRRPRESYGDEL